MMAAGQFESLRDRYNGTGQTVPDRNYLRMSGATRERLIRDVAKCQSLYFVMVASVYNVAHGAMADALALLRASRHFRHRVKRDANEAMRLYYDWERRMRTSLERTDHWQLWLDLSDSVAEQAEPFIASLRDSMLAVMRDNGEPEAELLSALLCSDCLSVMADKTIGRFAESVQKAAGIDVSPMFGTQSVFAPVAAKWHAVCAALLENRPGADSGTLNLARFGECAKALDRLESVLYDFRTYDRAGEYSIKLAGLDIQTESTTADPMLADVYRDMTANGETAKEPASEPAGKTVKPTETKQVMEKKNSADFFAKTFYEVKLKYETNSEAGPGKEESGTLLVEADSLTEAEAEAFRAMERRGLGVQEVVAARRTKIHGVLGSESAKLWPSKWFKARIDEIIYTASGKEKPRATYYVVGERDIDEATAVVKRYTKDWRPQDFRLAAVSETKCLFVSEREEK